MVGWQIVSSPHLPREIGIFRAWNHFFTSVGDYFHEYKCIPFSHPGHAMQSCSLLKNRGKKTEDFNVTHLTSFFRTANKCVFGKTRKGARHAFQTGIFLSSDKLDKYRYHFNADLISFVSTFFGFVASLSNDPAITKRRLKNASEMDCEQFELAPHFGT